jgi:acetylornithine deacetylase/succinyl-diaminopimelate desuccinylase-like protein
MTEFIPRLLDLAVAIQQIPAPTFQEMERAEFVRSRFVEEGLQDVEIDAIGNVLARVPADRQSQTITGRPLIISAHLDTVFPAGTDLKVFRESGRISGAGIGDNALGVAGLFGLLWMLRERSVVLPADLWLVANVCEEGLGGLRGMHAVVERFGENPRAYIVLEGMALGQIYHRALGVRRYRIIIRTQGGHSWNDYGQPSAVHELTALAARITSLKVPSEPRTTLNVGTISGGTSVNTIAAEAMLELDLRSEHWQTLEQMARQVEDLVEGVRRPGVDAMAGVIGQRPAGEIPPDHLLVKLAQDGLRALGIEPHLNIGSTDANYPLSLGLPAVTIGLTNGRGAHTVHEYINTEPLTRGIEQVVGLVNSIP